MYKVPAVYREHGSELIAGRLPQSDAEALEVVQHYHERTKHQVHRSARSLGYMDWANQPNPFRRYEGAAIVPLDHPANTQQPTYDSLFLQGSVAPHPLNRTAISELFYHSLALSAWKQAGPDNRWSLRVNPSSGNLHPTEGYLIGGSIEGLCAEPSVFHYSPYQHALEQRRTLALEDWRCIADQLPTGAVLVALTSIYCRESWKYGERAFRYCHHDVGHAIGAVAIAGALLGWYARLVDTVESEGIHHLLGIADQHGPEAEHADCLVALSPRRAAVLPGSKPLQLSAVLLERLKVDAGQGEPNPLSRQHQDWSAIEQVSAATRIVRQVPTIDGPQPAAHGQTRRVADDTLPDRRLPARHIIRRRRSAVAMDGVTSIERDTFYQMMAKVMPDGDSPAFTALPWDSCISLALFVHRVAGLDHGLYLLVRHPRHEPSLRESLRKEFAWTKPQGCPVHLPLFLMKTADYRQTASLVSCHQSIAADGAFSLGMLADYEGSLRHNGPAFYPRLFWETGLIGWVMCCCV